MNAIGCNQVEPDFAVTIPHPTRKAEPPNLNNYRSYTFGGLVAMYESERALRVDEVKKYQKVRDELHSVLAQRDAAENKCEAQAKRIRELEAENAELCDAADFLVQKNNGLGDINIAQAAELSKLREQLKGHQADDTIHFLDLLTRDKYTVSAHDHDSTQLEIRKIEGKKAGSDYTLRIPIQRLFSLGRASVE